MILKMNRGTTWTDLDSIMLSKIRHRNTIWHRQIPYDLAHVEFKKSKQKIKRQSIKQTLNFREQTDGHQRGGEGN